MLQGPCQMFVLRESAGLALFRSLTVPLLDSVPSCCCCFILRCPLFFFLGLAVLADASTAFAIVSLRLFSFGHNWHYSPPVGSLANSQHSCQIIGTSPLHATPVDRSLVMRAFGGAITSPCSNDSECRRPTPAIFGLYPFLLRFCWLVENHDDMSYRGNKFRIRTPRNLSARTARQKHLARFPCIL